MPTQAAWNKDGVELTNHNVPEKVLILKNMAINKY
jgi:hypothetical protein